MANDDLMIEVTGSSTKASNALDKVIEKVTRMQEAIEKIAPSLSKFTESLDSIASTSKAFSALEKLTKGTGDLSAASKKAEANEAMYQARRDRGIVSSEKATVQHYKLADSLRKVAEAEQIAAYNKSMFSMPSEDFSKKFVQSTPTTEPVSSPIPSVTAQNVPTINYDTSKIQAEMDAFTAKIGSKGPKINIDTEAATAEVRRMGEYIDSLTPKISHMSAEAQAQFNAIAAKLTTVSQKIDNQRMLYSSLQDQAARVGTEQGEGSMAYLTLEKRILSANSATQKLSDTQEKLKAELSSVTSTTNKVGAGMTSAGSKSEKAADKSKSSWGKTLQMMQKMFIRIAAFRIFSAISQGIVTGINDIVQANSQANDTMSALATNSLYLKNSLGAALMPVLQALVPVLNQVTDAIASVFNGIAMLTARIFNHSETAVIATRANVNYAETLGKTADNASDATKKVKELQRTVMGFDELNILQKQNEDIASTPSAGGSGSSNPGMPDYGQMFKTVQVPGWMDKVGDFTDQIGKIINNWWSGLTDAQKWGAGIGGTAGFVIGGIIGHLIGGPIGAIVGSILGGVIGTIIGAWWAGLTDQEKWGVGLGGTAGTVIGGIIGGILTHGNPIGIAVGSALGGTVGLIIGKWWADLTTPEKWSVGIGGGFGAVIGGIIGGILTGGNPIGIAVGAFLGGTVGTIIGKWWADLTDEQKWSVGIGSTAGATIGGIIGGLIAGPIGAAIGAALGGALGGAIGKFWDKITDPDTWKFTIPKMPEYGVAGDAEGTDYHMGGPALVNDQPGSVYRELVKLPNGKAFIPKGRNVLIPDLPVGSSVLDAEKTKQLFPNYAEGTSAIEAELSSKVKANSQISNVFANVFTIDGKINESVFGASKNELDSITTDMKKASDDRMKIVEDELSSTKSKWADFFDSISSTFSDKLNNILSICKKNSDDLSSVWNRTSDNSESTFRNMFSYVESGFSEFSRSIDETAREIANNVSSKIGGSVNGVIEGINWTLGAIGSSTKIDSVTWPSYASGVEGHPGGPALVNDQSGSIYRELVQLPNGKAFIPKGKNVLIPDLPKGSKVLPANKTHKLFPMYANGIGDFFNSSSADMDGLDISSVWEHMGNVGELLQLVVDKFVKKSDINEPWSSLETSAVKLLTSNASDFIGKEFSKYQSAFSASGSGVDRWSGVATQALKMTGQYSEANLSRLLYQMQTESGGNPASINDWDINAINGTPSKGLMQVIDPTFRAYAYPDYDSNIYDPLSNILAAIRYTLSRYGSLENGWQGHGYAGGIGKFNFGGWCADGGMFDKPTVIGVGESGPEASLPLNDNAFSRIAQGIVKNSDSSGNESVLERMDSIADRLQKLESAILERPVNLYTDDQKIAESANRGNTRIARRYHTAT